MGGAQETKKKPVVQFTRYAIYYTPSPGPLATFGAAWLGWDAGRGCAVKHLPLKDLPCTVATLADRPRKYGFHGTLKPPFRLAEGHTPEDLKLACRDLAQSLSPAPLNGLSLLSIGHFLALTLKGDTSQVDTLAGKIVQHLDLFRAPTSVGELERRQKANLSPSQKALLLRWGYPYVMEAFRFHMTLTGPIASDQIDAVHKALLPTVAPLLTAPQTLSDLTLVGEGPDGMFREIARYHLGS